MSVVPVIVLHGGSAAQRSALLLDIAARADANARILHLRSGLDGGHVPGPSLTATGIESRVLPPACPCCTGAVTFRVQVNRLLREVRPARMVIELPRGWHPNQFVAMLHGEQFASTIAVEAMVDAADAGIPPTP